MKQPIFTRILGTVLLAAAIFFTGANEARAQETICNNFIVQREQGSLPVTLTTADVRGDLTLGTNLSANFSGANEVHLYRVVFTEPGSLTAFTTGPLDTEGGLVDGNCVILGQDQDGDSGSGYNFRFTTRVLPAGTYYLGLYEWEGDFGTYTLTTNFTSDRPPGPGTDAVTDYRRRVTAMYVAYYGRPGDAGGLDFWTRRLNEVSGDLSEIVDSFGNSAEYRDRFGDLEPEELVNNIFMQLLGRGADPEGQAFYANGFRSGEFGLAGIALNIFDGASGEDLDTVNNKLRMAEAFTAAYVEAGAHYGEFQIRDALLWLAEVDNTDASVTAARQRLPNLVDTFPPAAGPAPEPERPEPERPEPERPEPERPEPGSTSRCGTGTESGSGCMVPITFPIRGIMPPPTSVALNADGSCAAQGGGTIRSGSGNININGVNICQQAADDAGSSWTAGEGF